MRVETALWPPGQQTIFYDDEESLVLNSLEQVAGKSHVINFDAPASKVEPLPMPQMNFGGDKPLTNDLEHTDNPPPESDSKVLPMPKMNFSGQGDVPAQSKRSGEIEPLVAPAMDFSKSKRKK